MLKLLNSNSGETYPLLLQKRWSFKMRWKQVANFWTVWVLNRVILNRNQKYAQMLLEQLSHFGCSNWYFDLKSDFLLHVLSLSVRMGSFYLCFISFLLHKELYNLFKRGLVSDLSKKSWHFEFQVSNSPSWTMV